MSRVLSITAASLVAVIAARLVAPPSITVSIVGIPRVVDGDSLVVAGIRIRLAAIDAPETDQICTDDQGHPYRCGLLATSVLEDEIAGREVTCTPLDHDQYGRTVATCTVGNLDLGYFMVRSGWAVDYYRYDPAGRYREAEREAKEALRGLWAGGFEMPERWRHRQ